MKQNSSIRAKSEVNPTMPVNKPNDALTEQDLMDVAGGLETEPTVFGDGFLTCC
jgi:hypothetical protein